ncbi:MAG: 50S ribosomal protein L6 [Deltaproteobacteria bacterium]|nr:50S ribosomal protein L6 [Deltaproteobacteria bacterium]
MSRIGKKPITIPDNTKITYKDRVLTVKGKKGTLVRSIHPAVELEIEKDTLKVFPLKQDRSSVAFQGMTRSLINNMVTGVSHGFERKLQINGIGYKAEAKGKQIILSLGYSHPIEFDLPEGISAVVEKNNSIKLSGIDKEAVGQTAAAIRQLRPPEPYKGKGVKYVEERIRKKAGKTGAT